MPLRFSRKDAEALVEAVARAEFVKPLQASRREVFRKYGLLGTSKDRVLTAIVYKLYRRQGVIDKIVLRTLGVSEEFYENLDPRARALLRLTVYFNVFDEVGDTRLTRAFMEYAKKECCKPGSSLSILLERLQRGVADLSKIKPQDELEELEFKYLISRRILELIQPVLGDELQAFLESINEKPWYGLRTNTLKARTEEILEELEEKGVEVKISPYVPTVVKYRVKKDSKLDYERLRCLREGKAVPQDDSSALASILLSPKPGETVADLCAAPGGKTTHMAELMENKGIIHAFDIYDDRIARLRELAEKTGTSRIIRVHKMDARNAIDVLGAESMDKVLVDPPCSSTGALAKHPDAKWRLKGDELNKLVKLQTELLDTAVQLVRPGGRILYTVCSILPQEGEEVVSRVLQKYREHLKLVPLNKPFEPSNILSGTMRAWPHKHETTGFFYALLEKTKPL